MDQQFKVTRYGSFIRSSRQGVNIETGRGRSRQTLGRLGAILAIPTMIFSWYGMNFSHIPELDWEYSYPVVVSGVTVCSLLLYVRLKRAGWL